MSSDMEYPEVDAFAERMRAEMVANAGKGDRWSEMTLWQAWCEISWHVGKMTGAIKAEDIDLIRELAADVANGALMLDVISGSMMKQLPLDPKPYRVQDYLMYWLGRAAKPDYNAKARYIFEPREGYSQNRKDYEA